MHRKILITIPNRSKFVTAWCYENAFRLVSEGCEVHILDLAKFELRYSGNYFYWIYDQFLEKNDIRKLVPRDLNKLGVKFLDPKRIILSKLFKNLSTTEVKFFDEVMRSCYAWRFGSSKIRAKSINSKLYQRELMNFALVLNSLRHFLRSNRYNEVFTVNGRTQLDACVIYCANEIDLKYSLIEKTSENWDYYSLSKVAPQNVAELDQKIRNLYDQLQTKKVTLELASIADNYFNSGSRNDRLQYWNKLQTESPDKKIDLTRTVIFFPGSDHEFAVVDSHLFRKTLQFNKASESSPKHFFINQVTAFEYLMHECKLLDLKLVVRAHPHPDDSHLQSAEGNIWEEICVKNRIELVPSSSKLDSMKLAKESYVNVVYQSSIATRLIFAELPVVIMGETEYTSFVPELRATNVTSLRNALNSPPKPNKDSILPWALYQSLGEYSINNFSFFNENEIIYNGKYLNSKRKFLNFFDKLIRKFKRKQVLFD